MFVYSIIILPSSCDEICFPCSITDFGKWANRATLIPYDLFAHLPKSVIDRASHNLEILEAQRHNIDLNREAVIIEKEPKSLQKVKTLLNKVDINQMTPMESMLLLADIKEIMGDEDE